MNHRAGKRLCPETLRWAAEEWGYSVSNRPAEWLRQLADKIEADNGVEASEPGRLNELEQALRDALDEFEDALPYVGEYFIKKWGYRDELRRLRAILGDVEKAAKR